MSTGDVNPGNTRCGKPGASKIAAGKTDPYDLPILVRRGEAGEPEKRRLEMQLAASALERELYARGVDYDQLDTTQPGDAALLRRLVNNALAKPSAQRSSAARRAYRGVQWLGWVFAAGAASAALAFGPLRVLQKSDAPAPCVVCTPGCEITEPARCAQRSLPAKVDTATVETSETAALVGAPAPKSEATLETATAFNKGSAASKQRHGHPSAAELFTSANSERKAGDSAAAITDYRELQQRHPGSREAAVSHVMLARLLLQRGQLSQAEQHFASYLRSGDSALAEEALVGRGNALSALGRKHEARLAYRALLARFPHSAYAEAVERNLQGLD